MIEKLFLLLLFCKQKNNNNNKKLFNRFLFQLKSPFRIQWKQHHFFVYSGMQRIVLCTEWIEFNGVRLLSSRVQFQYCRAKLLQLHCALAGCAWFKFHLNADVQCFIVSKEYIDTVFLDFPSSIFISLFLFCSLICVYNL